MVLGISTDSTAANRAFRDKFEFPYDLLSDADGAVSRSCGAITGDGPRARRVSLLIGSDGRIARVYGQVQPATHPDEVLADLAALDA